MNNRLFFIERGFLNGNHFVYRSENPILIDTAYIADFNETAELIAQLGVNLPDVRLIISTHCHCDHIGGNKLIQDQSGCDIALHKIGKHFIDTRNDWATWWKYYNQEAEFFDCTVELNDGDDLMRTHWYKETVDLYFSGEYQAKYEAIMKDFRKREIIKEKQGKIFTSVKP